MSYLQKSHLLSLVLHKSRHNKDSGVNTISGLRKISQGVQFSSIWSREGPFPRPSSPPEVFKIATLSRGVVRPTDLQVAHYWSEEREVADEGDLSFRIAHPLNLCHSALLSFCQDGSHIPPSKALVFYSLLSVSLFPRPYLSGIPRMKNDS